jgi:hypothetical protein
MATILDLLAIPLMIVGAALVAMAISGQRPRRVRTPKENQRDADMQAW